MLTETIAQYSVADFAGEVRSGLTQPGQKELPSKYLYDEVGSALFEVITVLPEYGLSRADERLLRKHAEAMVAPLFPAPVVVAELGSGSGKKTRWILQALARHQKTTYYPIEISPAALSQCTKELGQLDRVSIVGVERAYLEGLASVAVDRSPGERLLVLFLGSTIGNFDRPAAEKFLTAVRRILQPGDGAAAGHGSGEASFTADSRAYDDPLGVTASFNLNLLARINRELGADFDLDSFGHIARYNSCERRIEMHLVSQCRQRVAIPGAGCEVTFFRGETIWTESSYKYRTEEVMHMARATGFSSLAQWIDAEWAFAETLLIAE